MGTLGKWVKEQRGAARVINARPTLDVLELGGRLVAIMADRPEDRRVLEGIFGPRDLSELIETANSAVPK